MDRIKLKAALTSEEAVRFKLYLDSLGVPTIGVGHNLRDKPISQRAVDVIFDDDVTDVETDLDRACAWWRQMDDVRQRVLADMCFNMGLPTLLTFKRTLLAMQQGQYALAADFMMESLWSRQVGDGPGGKFDRAERLSAMMRTGKDL